MVRLWIVFLEPLLGLSQQSSQGVGWKKFVLTNHPAPHHLSRCGWVGEKISHLRVKHGIKQLCSKMAQGRVQRFRACVLIAILKSWTDCQCQKSGDAPSLTGGGHHHAHKLVTPSLQTLHSKLARSSATVVPVSRPERSFQLSSRRACCAQAPVGQSIHVLCGPQSDEKASTGCLKITQAVPQQTQRKLILATLWPHRGPAQQTHRYASRDSTVVLQHSTETAVYIVPCARLACA